jgi:hypothetical protein
MNKIFRAVVNSQKGSNDTKNSWFGVAERDVKLPFWFRCQPYPRNGITFLALGIKGVQEFAEIAYSQGKTFGRCAGGKILG